MVLPMNKNKWVDSRRAVGGCTSCSNLAAKNRSRCLECLEKRRTYMITYMQNPEKRQRHLDYAKKYKDKLRHKVIELLGSECKCCQEAKYEFLNLDHKYNDGAEQRKQLGYVAQGTGLYVRLLRDKELLNRFQLLCWNCNCAKGIFGYCPHEHTR